MNKTAIILGATGLTGSILLEKLLNDHRYKSIKLFSRKPIDGLPQKVEQFIGDIIALEQFKKDFTADEVFCCIGTTAKKTPDKQRYKKIDFGIPVTAAKLAKANKIPSYLVISSLGANANSPIFYNKVKGEMEQAVLLEQIKKTHILQPSIIGGQRKETRIGEKIGLVVLQLLQPLFFGSFKKYRITEAEDIAQAMIQLANSKFEKQIITSEKIKEITTKN